MYKCMLFIMACPAFTSPEHYCTIIFIKKKIVSYGLFWFIKFSFSGFNLKVRKDKYWIFIYICELFYLKKFVNKSGVHENIIIFDMSDWRPIGDQRIRHALSETNMPHQRLTLDRRSIGDQHVWSETHRRLTSERPDRRPISLIWIIIPTCWIGNPSETKMLDRKPTINIHICIW